MPIRLPRRSPAPPSRRGGPVTSRLGLLSVRAWLALTVLALLAALVPDARPAVAQEPGEGGGPTQTQTGYLQPMSPFLSGSSYLVAAGLDPRLFGGDPAVASPADALMGVGAGGGAQAPSAQQVPFRSAAPAFSRNIILTRQLGYAPYQTEPHIAVDPLDPEHLVAGVIDYNFGGAAAYVSFDGGETWDGPQPVRFFREDLAAGGDPVVTFDREGNVYLAQISIGIQDFRVGSLASSTLVSTMAVAKSVDGGLTWLEPVAAATAPVVTSGQIDDDGKARGELTIPFLDKEWITAGPNPEDPESDLIHLTYTEFATRYQVIYADEVPFLSATLTESVIKSASSADGGTTWSAPVAVSPVVFFTEGGGSGPEAEEGGVAAPAEAAVPAAPGSGQAPAPADADAGAPAQATSPTPTAVPDDGDPETPNRGGRTAASPTPSGADDAGATAEEPTNNRGAQADQEAPGATRSERVVQGSQPAVLSDGTLVVAYHDTTEDGFQQGLAAIQVATSTDGGATFSKPRQAEVFREIRNRPRAATFRLGGSGFPQIAVGPEDEIYIANTQIPVDKPLDDGDVYLTRSMDGAASWSEPLRINGDDTTRPQFYPSIDVSEDGVVHAMWGDMRDDPDEIRYHIYYSRSGDQGETWGFEAPELGIAEPDTRVTDFASNALRAFVGGRFIGDYFSLAANTDDVYMVWADSRLGEYGGPNQQIAFARQTAINPPELFLNPPAGPAGRDVTIQGFGFQPLSDILIQIGGVNASTVRSNEDGEFTTTIYTPLTGEGPRNITAYDPTGNVATASFYTEFGFDTLQRSQQELTTQVQALQGQIDAMSGAQPAGTPGAGTPSALASPVATPGASPAASPAASFGGLAARTPLGSFEGPATALGLALAAGYVGYRWGQRKTAA